MKAVLFDFDYTLVDASLGIIESANYALRAMGLRECDGAAIRATIGLSLSDTFLTLTGVRDAASSAEYRRFYLERAGQVMSKRTTLLPGARDCLQVLQRAGLRLGIVSTKVRASILGSLRELEVDVAFSAIIGGDDVVKNKPAPEGIVQALVGCEALPAQALYVGDSVVDVEAARNAGVDFVGVLTGTHTRQQLASAGARVILEDLRQLDLARVHVQAG